MKKTTYTKMELENLTFLVSKLIFFSEKYDERVSKATALKSKEVESIAFRREEKESYPFLERVLLDGGKKLAYISLDNTSSIASIEIDSTGEYIPSHLDGVFPFTYGESVYEIVKKVRDLKKDSSPIEVDTYGMSRKDFLLHVKKCIREATRDYMNASFDMDEIEELSSMYRDQE